MINLSHLPADLADMVRGASYGSIDIGDTKDTVIRFDKDGETCFLKMGKINPEAYRERDMLIWLKGKLPVPDVLYWGEADGEFYQLTTAAAGKMADEQQHDVIPALADGLLQFQNIDISACPLSNRLEQRLEAALYNIENDLVDLEDFADNGRFATPIELYDYLVRNKPDEELCLTHGDYCLPNIFIENGKATGFIDMGRGGVSDKCQDIAICVRSSRKLGDNAENLLFEHLGIKPDWDKVDYYILLDELF